MGADTAIEWADHTFNPWTGCTRVSPGCNHCYAAELAKRNPATFGSWEPGGDRKRTSAANWQKPLAWNRKAEAEGRRMRVFCASMADVFDNQVPQQWRRDLWLLINATPHLDWLLLTKRPQNIAAMLPSGPGMPAWGAGWPNVWLGTTVENQAEADRRIPHLLAVPAAKRFLSCEPLLGPVSLRWAKWDNWRNPDGSRRARVSQYDGIKGIHWVIAGGESGPGARPMHPDWARNLRDQCAAAGVPFFFKQWGNWLTGEEVMRVEDGQEHHDHIAFADGSEVYPALSDGWDITYDIACRHRGEPKQVWREFFGSGEGHLLKRVGKKAAGRLLDGREHSEVPA